MWAWRACYVRTLFMHAHECECKFAYTFTGTSMFTACGRALTPMTVYVRYAYLRLLLSKEKAHTNLHVLRVVQWHVPKLPFQETGEILRTHAVCHAWHDRVLWCLVARTCMREMCVKRWPKFPFSARNLHFGSHYRILDMCTTAATIVVLQACMWLSPGFRNTFRFARSRWRVPWVQMGGCFAKIDRGCTTAFVRW